jgi:hypothetical protein
MTKEPNRVQNLLIISDIPSIGLASAYVYILERARKQQARKADLEKQFEDSENRNTIQSNSKHGDAPR